MSQPEPTALEITYTGIAFLSYIPLLMIMWHEIRPHNAFEGLLLIFLALIASGLWPFAWFWVFCLWLSTIPI